ncbi:MAG: PAS domain-containing sensor histidine kinase [Candidatus Obscuribacterales bacterium]|nr:PAS domain-containing sensor histidine kinase [Candidatus Obscuribacterales bacterium]
MGGKNTGKIVMMVLAVASTIIGVITILLSQQLTQKVIENSPDLPEQARRFQNTFGRFSSLIFFIGAAEGVVGVVLLGLLFRSSPSASSAANSQIGELLALFPSQQNAAERNEDPMRKLKDSISRVNLELLEARKRERAVVERAVDVICIIDIESKFVSVSKASKSAWGYEPQELERQPLFNYLVSERADDILGSILGSAASIDKIVFECKLRKKNGDLIDVVWTGHWSASDSGLFCIVHDITERKKAEELVKESEARLRHTLEGLPAGVLIAQNNGQIEFANSEAAKLFACSIDDLVGKQVATAIKDRKPFDRADHANSKNGAESARVLASGARPDGSFFPVEISENRIALGGEAKTIAVFLDKTEQEELEKMKSEFIAMLTHDLKTPLTSIHGILALLEEGVLGQLSEHGCEMTRRVRLTCKRLLRLINDMLDLEKIDAGKFSLECKDARSDFVVQQSVETVENLASERKISINASPVETTCWGDEDRLVQVLVNLLSNAIKYSADNGVIEVLTEDSQSAVKFSVVDHGRGIPEDKVSRVFEKFEQVEVSDAKKKGGTGLGLAICQAIVREHGGEIGVVSKLGEGSCFWFSIPKKS